MEICPLNPNGRRGGKADRLVIALDRPVQVGACPFGGPALISLRTHHRRHSGMRRKAQARNPYSRRRVRLAAFAEKRRRVDFCCFARMAQGPSARWLWIPGSRFARPEMTRDG